MREKIIDNDTLKFKYVVYENGDVYNETTGKQIKPSKDKRRPNEPPAIYFKKKDDKREFWYHDVLMATLFIDGYDQRSYIHHKDGNIENCSLDNLYYSDGLSMLQKIYGETKRWEPVRLDDVKLYYDYYICEDGRLYNATTGSFIKTFKDKRDRNKNFQRYNLYYGKSISDTMHIAASRLVALHFIPKPDDKDIVIFKDGNYDNIDASNLYWGDNWDSLNKEFSGSREFGSLYSPFLGKEKWKPLEIPGVNLVDNYKVSNYGRIYNETKAFYCMQVNSGTVNMNNQYHQSISLCTEDKGYQSFLAHRIVAYAFCKNQNPEVCNVVNHINGNPECNLAINLEWVTLIDNLRHALDTNLMHSNKFIGNVNSTNWRLNTLLAWIYSLDDINDESAYKFYNLYLEKYSDNIPKLSYEEFVKEKEDRESNNQDFQKLFDYYRNDR